MEILIFDSKLKFIYLSLYLLKIPRKTTLIDIKLLIGVNTIHVKNFFNPSWAAWGEREWE